MTPPSGGKLELKIEKNFKKKCFFGGVPQVQTLNYGHDSCVRLNKTQILSEFRVLREFLQKVGGRNCQKIGQKQDFS